MWQQLETMVTKRTVVHWKSQQIREKHRMWLNAMNQIVLLMLGSSFGSIHTIMVLSKEVRICFALFWLWHLLISSGLTRHLCCSQGWGAGCRSPWTGSITGHISTQTTTHIHTNGQFFKQHNYIEFWRGGNSDMGRPTVSITPSCCILMYRPSSCGGIVLLTLPLTSLPVLAPPNQEYHSHLDTYCVFKAQLVGSSQVAFCLSPSSSVSCFVFNIPHIISVLSTYVSLFVVGLLFVLVCFVVCAILCSYL